MDDEANLNPYVQLELSHTATEKDIKSAYRKKSLKCHPDRNPDNPEAAHQFHLLSLAQALLLDGPKRAALDVKLEATRKRAEKMAGLESRKRNMVQDLVAKEEAFKRSRLDLAAQSRQKAQEASVQSEGRKLREAAEAARLAALDDTLRLRRETEAERTRLDRESERAKGKSRADFTHSSSRGGKQVDEIERTLTLTFPLPQYASSTSSPSALSAFLSESYGSLANVVLRPPRIAKKSSKSSKSSATLTSSEPSEQVTAMVVFPSDNLAGCWALMEDGKRKRTARLEGIKIKWGLGQEPDWVERLGSSLLSSSNGKTDTDRLKVVDESSAEPRTELGQTYPSTFAYTPAPAPARPSTMPSFGFDPAEAFIPSSGISPPDAKGSVDYENATLLRMRQAERERLEREIREAEGEDD
ncbi:Molecular chaperone (DnaJ superfamily) [Phaffia rhodozyma]|uniref:Molecular chaperone (DnaJ superfamily) n=1 Tax=Phaffia rhodozyma TaxID=264483 RepID=A0A0F7SFP9_PHARH|nr:Molecular chaperone (DnaJ superfamily) [Phaffia rhodozyma]